MSETTRRVGGDDELALRQMTDGWSWELTMREGRTSVFVRGVVCIVCFLWVCVKWELWGWINWSYGVMVSTLDFESSDPGSSPGRTFVLRFLRGRWACLLCVVLCLSCVVVVGVVCFV